MIAAAGVLLTASAVAPSVAVGDTDGAIDAYLREELSASGIPGLAVSVIEDGRPSFEAAYGTDDGDPMTTDTPLLIGSVGKSITALAIRQLEAAGMLDLDAPVTRYLPWFSLATSPAEASRITVRSLLSHTSGISTADGQDPRWYEPGLTSEAVARSLRTVRPNRAVGSYEYSNLNYVVLGVLVEAVAKVPYGTYVADHIFTPLGMANSRTSLTGERGTRTGSRFFFGIPIAAAEPFPSAIVPAGYQLSTAADMGHFVAALAAGGVYGGVDVVTGRPATGPGAPLGTDWQPVTGTGPGAASGQSGSTLATNGDILVELGTGRAVVVLLNANPTQLLGLPKGAGDLALDVLRLSEGQTPVSTAPTVRTVYLVVDAVLLLLLGLLGVHVVRATSWRRRYRDGRHRHLLLTRTVVADLALPVAVLVGVPLAIGATGSAASGDIIGGWRFALWTVPDVAVVLLTAASLALGLGVAKLIATVPGRRRRPDSVD